MIGSKISEAEAVAVAQKFIELRTESYPLMPLTECGDIDFEAYEPGCTDWNILEEFTILRAEVAPIVQDDDVITVEVEIECLWSQSEGEKETCTYHVYVELDTNPSLEEISRGSFEYDIVG